MTIIICLIYLIVYYINKLTYSSCIACNNNLDYRIYFLQTNLQGKKCFDDTTKAITIQCNSKCFTKLVIHYNSKQLGYSVESLTALNVTIKN